MDGNHKDNPLLSDERTESYEMLEPCPFCGSENLRIKPLDDSLDGWVCCRACETTGPIGDSPGTKASALKWNSRPEVYQLKARLAALMELVGETRARERLAERGLE